MNPVTPDIGQWSQRIRHALIHRFSLRTDQADDSEIDKNIRDGIELNGTYLWTLMCAILVASIGLNINSTAVIIGAMLIHPKILILDEPFNYLDPSSQINISRLIQKVNKEHGTTVLISSHNLNFISEICDRILLMEKGIIVKDLENNDGSAEKELQDYFERG